MLQAVVKKGKVVAELVPSPNVSTGAVLIKVVHSCISAGTEMSGVNESGKPLIKRALEQPEQVKQVLNFAKENGIKKTIARVKGTLDGGKVTGYSIAGIILAVGEGVTKFQKGDRVAAAGAGLANHAEFVDVPQNLVMRVPDSLDLKHASTVTLGGIAMQGVRRADLRLGENAVVVGAGILGLLAVQMLKASGVRVMVTDLDKHRLGIAKELGADVVIDPSKEDPILGAQNFSGGNGTDAVIFTAATGSSAPLSQSFKMCRRKGRVVLVGVSGMEINRGDIYKNEIDFMISTSYGPGRYDPIYEEKGIDYPYSYVRWTENRNMENYLQLVASGAISLDEMIDAHFKIEEVDKAYETLNAPGQKPIMVILDYGNESLEAWENQRLAGQRVEIKSKSIDKKKLQVGLIGAGSFATGMHLPNMQALSDKFQLKAIANRTGQKGKAVGQQYGADYTTSNVDELLADKDIDLTMICTRHGNHAELVMKSLKAGKHTFVEKPLAISDAQLQEIEDFYAEGIDNKPLLMVGFNRRFSKCATEIRKYTDERQSPLVIRYRMNAGFIPLDHWVHDDGGRIIGEGCHLIDLVTSFTNNEITNISVASMGGDSGKFSKADNKILMLEYLDGSIATIEYIANGSKQLPKEYMEIHFDGKAIIMNDYKSLKGFGVSVKEINSSISQKGQLEELRALHDSVTGKNENWPIELWDMIQTTRATFVAAGQF